MAEAKKIYLESKERQHPTGAVVVKDGNIVGRACNNAPIKNPFIQRLHKRGLCTRRILGIPTGKKYWMCPGCARSSNHAEALSIDDAEKRGNNVKGADLYLYGHWWCCEPCWTKMIRSEIKDVYVVDGASDMFKR